MKQSLTEMDIRKLAKNYIEARAVFLDYQCDKTYSKLEAAFKPLINASEQTCPDFTCNVLVGNDLYFVDGRELVVNDNKVTLVITLKRKGLPDRKIEYDIITGNPIREILQTQ